jgi:hypothetical protein
MADERAALLFAGEWVGATQGCPAPAHLWSIAVRRARLLITTRWEGGHGVARLNGQLLPDGAGFAIDGTRFRALSLGPQHFVVPGWDTNDTRGGEGAHFDVIFARPGVAELAAPAVYRRYLTLARGA